MKDITAYPNAAGSVSRQRRESSEHTAYSVGIAMGYALIGFRDKHGREPDWDNMFFRGGVTMTDIIVEIWEEL